MAVKSHIKNHFVLECYKINFFPSSFSPRTVVNSVDLEELLSVLSRPQEQCCWNLGGGRGMGDKGGIPPPPDLVGLEPKSSPSNFLETILTP